MPDPAGGLSKALPFIGAALGGAQTIYDVVKKIGSQKKINTLLGQRKSFQTQQEIYDILGLTLNQAQGDTITRDYQTNQLQQSTANVLGVAARGGADPNTLSNLLQNSVNGMMQIGNQFHESNIKGLGAVINALKLVSDNKDAEFASEQDIVKDKLAAAGANLASSTQGISSGLNMLTGSLASKGISDLYKPQTNETDMAKMINDLIMNDYVKKQVSGSVTDKDSIGSMLQQDYSAFG